MTGRNTRIDPGTQKAFGSGIRPDRRHSPRYGLRLAATILAVDGHGVAIAARTRNVSRDGVLIVTPARLTAGQAVEYVVELYPEYGLQMKCRGRILRRTTVPGEGGDGAPGAPAWALSIESMEYSWRPAPQPANGLGCGPLVAV
jgi:hypothetical protein